MRKAAFFVVAIVAFAPANLRAAESNWSGIYGGFNAGGGWSNANWQNKVSNPAATFFDYVPGQGFSHNLSGILGGAQIGVNFQNGPWVYGLEAMLDGAAISGVFNSNSGAADDQFNLRLDAVFLVTGRLGYAWNNWLAYGKAGWAAAKINVSVSDIGPPTTGSGNDSQWRSGFTLGAGLEYRLTPQWSVGADYSYLHLDAGDYQLGGSAGNYMWDIDISDIHLLMLRLNYRFGGI